MCIFHDRLFFATDSDSAHFESLCRLPIDNLDLLTGPKRYLVQSTKLYSISDLASIDSGVIVDYLNKVYHNFDKHIRSCDICTGKGTMHFIKIIQ